MCLFHLVLWTDYYRDFQKENELFTKDLFPQDSKDKKLAGLIYNVEFRGEPVYMHFPNYYTIWNQGIATSSILDYRFGTVVRRNVSISREVLPHYIEWIGLSVRKYNRKFALFNFKRYENMDFVLVRGKIPEDPLKYFKDFKLGRKTGDWTLYEKKNGTE